VLETTTTVAARKDTFPVTHAVLVSVLVGAIYFLPQALYFLEWRAPQILLEENYEETLFAVLASRAAGEHPGQPDPYRLNVRGDPQASSFSAHSAQAFPPVALAAVARALHLPVAVVFWAGAFVFPAIVAFLFISIAWLVGLSDPALLWLAVVLSLLALPPPYWVIWGKQVWKILEGLRTDFRLMLPYIRRFQPQFTAVFHYAAIAASLLLLHPRAEAARGVTPPARPSRLPAGLSAAVTAGLCFGISFYCYFFSWSILLGWFTLGGVFVWMWHREKFRLWLLTCGIGLAIAAPYFALALHQFDSLSASAGAGRSHQIDPDLRSDLLVLLVLVGLLLACLLRERKNRELLWVPLALNVAAGVGAVQNVITGVYIQPFHYIHYFARPTVSLALVALLGVALHRFDLLPRRAAAVQAVCAVLLGLVVFSSVAVQWHHYRVARTSAQPVFEALAAIDFLQHHAAPGAMVYSPEQVVQEAVPLLTNAVPYFSQHMWTNETPRNREALLERIAAAHALYGVSEPDFAALVRSRPWMIYAQYIVRRIDPHTAAEMRRMERTLLTQFHEILAAKRPAALDGLCYLLLPASSPLEATRFPQYFLCRKVWSDGRYAVFELGAIPHG
jgi:hypothetical protein